MLSMAVLVVAAVLCVWRTLRPGSLADRSLALDTLVNVVISGLAVAIVATGDDVYVDVALMGGLLGFLGTVAVARYIGRRGL